MLGRGLVAPSAWASFSACAACLPSLLQRCCSRVSRSAWTLSRYAAFRSVLLCWDCCSTSSVSIGATEGRFVATRGTASPIRLTRSSFVSPDAIRREASSTSRTCCVECGAPWQGRWYPLSAHITLIACKSEYSSLDFAKNGLSVPGSDCAIGTSTTRYVPVSNVTVPRSICPVARMLLAASELSIASRMTGLGLRLVVLIRATRKVWDAPTDP